MQASGRPTCAGSSARTSCAFSTRLTLEEELGLVVVDEQADLLGEHGVVVQGRVGVDDGEGDLAGPGHPRLVAPQRRQLEVAAALLPGAEDRALAPDLEVDLGQLEAVGRALERRQPLL